MNTPSFSLPSFAKINWNLRVLGKRPDGYHEVRTLLQTISLHDELQFEWSDDQKVVLTSDDPAIPTDESNLIVRAAALLQERFGITAGARVSLRKEIPVKGGLGGASSNAAVAIMGLARVWQVEPSVVEMFEMAAGLGADVPFFLIGGCVYGSGIGTSLTVLSAGTPRPAIPLLVVTPNAAVSTSDAYEALGAAALTSVEAKPILAVSHEESVFSDSDPWELSRQLTNDFENVIFEREPEIRRARNAVLQAGATGALLAGSGSSVFGIFESLEAQKQAIGLLQAEAGWRVFPCVTMSRTEYSRAIELPKSLRCF